MVLEAHTMMRSQAKSGNGDSRSATNMLLSSVVEDSRETLQAMIELEQKFYLRSSYLFPSDCDEHEEVAERKSGFPMEVITVEDNRRSSLNMIQEMASLVADFDIAAVSEDFQEEEEQEAGMSTPHLPPKDKKCYPKANSPTSSAFDLYEIEQQPRSEGLSVSKPSTKKRRRPSALEVSCLSNWRHQMFDWTCSVCQNFLEPDHSGTVIATTFSILDRYLCTVLSMENELDHETSHPLGISREKFQLVCMVSLYIASKTVISAQQNKLTVASLVGISRELYTAEDITALERDILLALNWHVNPPTISCFCRIFLKLFPFEDEDCDQQPQNIAGMAKHQCEYLAEVALDDVFFLDKAASTIGLAIVVLVTDSIRNKRKHAAARRRRSGGSLNIFLLKIQGIVNVHNSEFDSILRRLECLL